MSARAFGLLMLLLAGSIGIAWGPATPAAACSCAVATTEEHTQISELVAEGEVTEVVPPKEEGESIAPTTYRVNLDRIWKGKAPTTIEFISPTSGASCGVEGISKGMHIVVFATHTDVMGTPIDGWGSILCNGTGPSDPGVTAELTRLLGEPREPAANPPTPPTGSDDYVPAPLPGWAIPLGLIVLVLAIAGVVGWRRRRRG